MDKFTCPHCGVEFGFPEDQAGEEVQCLGCRRELVLPGSADAEEVHQEAGASQPSRPDRSSDAPGILSDWTSALPAGALATGGVVLLITALARPESPRPFYLALALMAGGFILLILGLIWNCVEAVRNNSPGRRDQS